MAALQCDFVMSHDMIVTKFSLQKFSLSYLSENVLDGNVMILKLTFMAYRCEMIFTLNKNMLSIRLSCPKGNYFCTYVFNSKKICYAQIYIHTYSKEIIKDKL